MPNPTDPVRNFGWPCYEGALDETATRTRASGRAATTRTWTSARTCTRRAPRQPRPTGPTTTSCAVVTDEDCRENSQGAPINTSLAASSSTHRPEAPSRPPTAARCSSATAGATASGRCCRGRTACREPSSVVKFAQHAESPLDLEVGPAGDLYYVDSENRGGEALPLLRPSRTTPIARPQRGSPLRIPLVLAYRECTAAEPRAWRAARSTARAIRRVTLFEQPHCRARRTRTEGPRAGRPRCGTRCTPEPPEHARRRGRRERYDFSAVRRAERGGPVRLYR